MFFEQHLRHALANSHTNLRRDVEKLKLTKRFCNFLHTSPILDSHTFIIIIIFHFPNFSAVKQPVKTLPVSLTQHLQFNGLPKHFLTARHVLSITASCIRIYTAGWRSSSFKISCNLLGIIPVVDSAGGILWAVFSCLFLISSSFKSGYFWNFSLMVREGCDC